MKLAKTNALIVNQGRYAMILCTLDQAGVQVPKTELFNQAFTWLKAALQEGSEITQKLAQASAGFTERVDIAGDDLYASLICYETVSSMPEKLEAHRKYVDIQIVFQGEEQIVVADLDKLTIHTPYIEAKDVEFRTSAYTLAVPMTPDRAMVLFPSDAHAAQVAVSTPTRVSKIVVKVRYH
jgi:YhcH/YjgK/YiaL family protein